MWAIVVLVTRINRILFIVAAVIIFAVVPMLLFEVIARYVFDAPTVWAMEASTLIFGPHFMLAGPYLLHLRGHVAVDIFSARATGKAKVALELFTFLTVAVFAAVFAIASWPLAMDAFSLGETSFSAWNPPIWWMKFIVPFAFVMLFAQALAEVLSVLMGRSDDTTPDAGKDAVEIIR